MSISSIHSVDTTPVLVPPPAAPEKSALPSLVEKPFYFSPTLTVDPKTGTAVLEIRNSSTGAVTAQYSTVKIVEAYTQLSLKPETTPVKQADDTAKAIIALPSQPPQTAAVPAKTPDANAAPTVEPVKSQSLIV